jgi:hypothetical protein
MAKKRNKIVFDVLDPSVGDDDLRKIEDGETVESPLIKSIVNSLDSSKKITRLAFDEDPSSPNRYGGLYFDKVSLLPDRVIKRISIVDDLIATIIRARGNHAASFGHELQDRFSTGFRIEPSRNGKFDALPLEKRKEILERVKQVTKTLNTCGNTKKWNDRDQMSLPTFMYLSATNAVKFGRFATEIVWTIDSQAKKTFYAFRPVDPGTIFKAIPKSHAADALRKEAIVKLERIKNEKLVPEKFLNDEYVWIQVIEGTPAQAFTEEELVVHNCYPVTDIEFNGYPVTPIDTAIAAITTHINITNHNKLYFQSGRASRGMLVIESDDIDASTLADLKQQFNASINSVANAWRMPVIKINKEDKVEWRPIDSGNRDMEFQYLSDSNARVILSAFHMSPDELPGYAHLSRGTNNQALSESNNEYKLEAARDVGLRPLLASLEDFLNSRILPLLDQEVAEYCSVRLHGLDAETPEKEATRIERDQALHGSMNETLRSVDKPTLPVKWAGDMIMNPAYQALLDKFFTVGEIKEYFLGIEGASKDPQWAYARDAFFFQNIQLVMQQKQMDDQNKIAEQQLTAQQQAPASNPQGAGQEQEGNDLSTGVDQLLQQFSKSEKHFSENKKKLMSQHDLIVKDVMSTWEKESEQMLSEIANLVNKTKK